MRMDNAKRLVADMLAFLSSPIWAWIGHGGEKILYHFYDGQFADNNKYLLAYHLKNCPDVDFVVLADKCTDDMLSLSRRIGEKKVICNPSVTDLIQLTKDVRIIVANRPEWSMNGRYWFFIGKTVVQLWHGIGFKKIGLIDLKSLSIPWRLIHMFEQRHTVSFFFSPSSLYTKYLFSKAIAAHNFIDIGNHPRNDIFFLSYDAWSQWFDGSLLEIGWDKSVLQYVRNGAKIISWFPTYRYRVPTLFEYFRTNEWKFLNESLAKRNMVLYIKPHPYEVEKAKNLLTEFSNVKLYLGADPQPLMYFSDALVTDYSSIYLDYVLLDRPIVFFPYDYQEYVTSEKKIVFDYEKVVLGPIINDINSLPHIVEHLLYEKDEWTRVRNGIRERIWGRKLVSDLICKLFHRV